jgi:hypothetical protein
MSALHRCALGPGSAAPVPVPAAFRIRVPTCRRSSAAGTSSCPDGAKERAHERNCEHSDDVRERDSHQHDDEQKPGDDPRKHHAHRRGGGAPETQQPGRDTDDDQHDEGWQHPRQARSTGRGCPEAAGRRDPSRPCESAGGRRRQSAAPTRAKTRGEPESSSMAGSWRHNLEGCRALAKRAWQHKQHRAGRWHASEFTTTTVLAGHAGTLSTAQISGHRCAKGGDAAGQPRRGLTFIASIR